MMRRALHIQGLAEGRRPDGYAFDARMAGYHYGQTDPWERPTDAELSDDEEREAARQARDAAKRPRDAAGWTLVDPPTTTTEPF